MSATVALWIIAAYYATRLIGILMWIVGTVLIACGFRFRPGRISDALNRLPGRRS